MTAYARNANGSWQTSSGWTPNGVPGDGDTVTNDGFAVTVDADAIIGTSPSDRTTNVLILDNGATLTIKAGVTFTLRGNGYASHGSTLQKGEASGGAVFEFDSHLAGDPTTEYHFDSGHFAFDSGNIIKSRGTSGSRSLVYSHASGGNGSFARATTQEYNGVFDLQDTDFLRIGSTTSAAFACHAATADGLGYLKIYRCTFDQCSNTQTVGNIAEDWAIDLQDSTWKNGVTGYDLYMTNVTGPPTNTRSITGCVFSQTLQLASSGTTFDDNVCLDHIGNGFETGLWASFAGNFLRIHLADSDMARLGDWHEVVIVNDGCTLDPYLGEYTAEADNVNPHWTRANYSGETLTVYDSIFEDFGSDDSGDIDLHNQTDCTSKFVRVIAISQDKSSPGTVTHSRMTGRYVYEHCTIQVGQKGLMSLAEENSPVLHSAEMLSCLPWRRNLDTSVYKIGSWADPTTLTLDIADPAKIDYNGGWNINTTGGLAGNGYDMKESATPGLHDVNCDPLFVDADRNFSTWVATLDPLWSGNPTPTRRDYNARGLHKLRIKNEPNHADYDSRYTLDAYKTYLRAGFAPQEPRLLNAGHDGDTIGAVAFMPDTSALAPCFGGPQMRTIYQPVGY